MCWTSKIKCCIEVLFRRIKNWWWLSLAVLLMSCTSVEYIKPIAPDCGVIETNGDLLDCYIKYRNVL